MRARAFLAVLLVALAACDMPVPEQTVSAVAPTPRPERPKSEASAPPTRSPGSFELQAHYARVQADLLSQGLLRTDGGGADTPFAAHNLTNNFIHIALYDEYVSRGNHLVAQQTASRLRRWQDPVNIQIHFGATVPAEQRARDTAALADYARRLSAATGHAVSLTQKNGNFHVLILHEDERAAYGSELRRLVPGIGDTAVETVESMPRDIFCLAFAFSRGTNADYSSAVAVIRAEHPDLLRLSCIHEEVAQGMGLANDSPFARPSIFNDDEEFALLTRQDELMLRILYDPRLKAGMDVETARPIVTTIASELMGGES